MLHVVTGPPCAGKTSYASSRKAQGEVVIDLDALCFALGGQFHGCTGAVRETARAARDAAVAFAVSRGVTAWIVDSDPPDGRRLMYEAHGARFHELDPGKDACIRRARDSKRPRGTVAAIERWYARERRCARASRAW